MNTRLQTTRSVRRHAGSRGSAMIVVMGILAILLIYSVGNIRTLNHLGREIRLVNEVQKRSWAKVEVQRSAGTLPHAIVPANTVTNLNDGAKLK